MLGLTSNERGRELSAEQRIVSYIDRTILNNPADRTSSHPLDGNMALVSSSGQGINAKETKPTKGCKVPNLDRSDPEADFAMREMRDNSPKEFAALNYKYSGQFEVDQKELDALCRSGINTFRAVLRKIPKRKATMSIE